MKRLLKVVGTVVLCFVVVLIVLSITWARCEATPARAMAQRGCAEFPRGLVIRG